jgi:hypothetical protein
MSRTSPNPLAEGLNSARSLLLETIKFQTGIDLSRISPKYFTLVDLWIRCEGLSSATARLKKIAHTATCSLYNQPNPEYPFLKTNRRGFPTAVDFLLPWADSSEGRQAIVSLLGWYRGLVPKNSPDLLPITEPGTKFPSELSLEIAQGLKGIKTFRLEDLSPPEPLFRSKKGPNGQATVSAPLDLLSLDDSQRETILDLADILEAEEFTSVFEELSENLVSDVKQQPKSGRLGITHEGGGKTRVFAIVDYWTQCLLSPLHDAVSKILQSIPQDCTYNQGKLVPELKKWTESLEGDLYSYDLSSATDRFPVVVQTKVLSLAIGSPEYAEKWQTLLTQRDFFYKGQAYKWAVGQPLGSLSSWPVFALTHHCLVRAAAKRCKAPLTYALLGDDIVIKGHALAKEYLTMISGLGVQISRSKSHIGTSAEFAKRIFFQGREESPIPVNLLNGLLRDPVLIRDVVQHLVARASIPIGALRLNSFLERVAGITRFPLERLKILVHAPCGTSGLGAQLELNPEGDSIWPENIPSTLVKGLYSVIKYKYLMDQYSKMMRTSSQQGEKIIASLEFRGLEPGARSLHPVYKALELNRIALGKAHKELGRFWTKLTQNPGLADAEMPRFNPIGFDCLTTSHRQRTKHEARVLLSTHSACLKLSKTTAALDKTLTLPTALKLLQS